MASPTELAREAMQHSELLRVEFEMLKHDVSQLSLQELRERVAVLEVLNKKIEKSLEEMKQFPVLENRIKQLEDRKLLGDTRIFQFILLFVGGVLTLAINIVVSFIRK